MEPLKYAPTLEARREVVPAPELEGSVIVRGLLASEAFAISSLRAQALRRVRQEVREAREEHDERVASMKPGTPAPAFEPPDVQMNFEELKAYGRYVPLLLQYAVVLENGLSLFTEAQWEVVNQHHPALVARLQAKAEALSGLVQEDVEKNSTPSPSSAAVSG